MIMTRALTWLVRRSAPLLLMATTAGMAAGGLARLGGATGASDAAWLAAAACGLGYALWTAASSVWRGRLSVDVIALALAGAVAVGELLAATVISVMLASGHTLEDWASARARHDLGALLARAPRTTTATASAPTTPSSSSPTPSTRSTTTMQRLRPLRHRMPRRRHRRAPRADLTTNARPAPL